MALDITVRMARQDDLPAVRTLLELCSLPADGIEAAISNAIVAEHDGVIVGSIAAEPFERFGLLRSLAVAPNHQGQQIGTALYTAAIAKAHAAGLEELILLTTTAGAFFAKRGSVQIPREEVPPALREHVQFRSACPQSAQCLHLVLETPSSP